MEISVKIKKISAKIGKDIKEPAYATKGSAGIDLPACIDEPLMLEPGQIAKIPTGIAIQLPSSGYGGFIFPRSGLASKHGLNLANCVGVIDSDYTGEVICPVQNNGCKSYTIQPGERVAQLVILPVIKAQFTWVDEIDNTDRGTGGFGSTGKN